MKFLIVLLAVLSVCLAEAPFNGYSYDKPQNSLNLPSNEYGPPPQQKQIPSASEVEITEENVEYAGQLEDATTIETPSNEYLPSRTEQPSNNPDEDVLRVQGLPQQYQQSSFNSQFRVQPQQFQQQKFQQQKFQQQKQFPQRSNFRQAQKFRQAPQQQQQQSFNQFETQQQQQQRQNGFRSGRLQAQPQQNNFKQFSARQEVAPPTDFGPKTYPAAKYGPPQEPQQPEDVDEENVENNGDQETEDVSDETDESSTVAISNAQNGQYYILAQDNTLQKVVFMTSQTEDDRRANGFTAQLRYAPVQPIRDPIYAYNEQGQLIRLYNKK